MTVGSMQHTSLLDPDSPLNVWTYTRTRLDEEMQIAYPGCRFVSESVADAGHGMVRIVRTYEVGASGPVAP